jgi:hypothetical protein
MNLKKYYSSFNKTELLGLLEELKKGCGAKVDSYGDCWHIVTNNPKYCNKCKRRMKIIEELLYGDVSQ